MHFAELAIFMVVVSTLATVNICKALDADGKEVPVEERRSGTPVRYVFATVDQSHNAESYGFCGITNHRLGLSSSPFDFKCRFEQRSADVTTIARDATS